MKAEDSLLCSQEPVTDTYPHTIESSPQILIPFPWDAF
jgi:hypothetical protein